MPGDQSALHFLFQLIWPSSATGGHQHTLVERLRQLRDTGPDFLTDDEYAQLRSEFLSELATRPRMPAIQVFTFVMFGLTGLAGLIYCLADHLAGAAWVPAVPLMASTLMWRRMEQDYAAKRRLTRTDRLTAVDDLVAAELLSAEEATALRKQIEILFDHERAA